MESKKVLVWRKSEGNCYLCGLPMSFDKSCGELLQMTLDHFIPKSRRGSNDIHNLVGTHLVCNRDKQNKKPSQLDEAFISSCQFKVTKLLRAYPELTSRKGIEC